jgi:hypothetical protein
MDEERNRPLTVITGGRKTREPRVGRRRALHHNEQITSWCRENEIGIASSAAASEKICDAVGRRRSR